MRIETLGLALYGARWQTELAAALGISDRHVRRLLVDGDLPIQYHARARELVADRTKQLRALKWN